MRARNALMAATLSAVNDDLGTSYTLMGRMSGGERNSGAWRIGSPDGEAVLKWVPDEPGTESQQLAATACERLSALGSPVPRYLAVGTVYGGSYAIMDLMPGTMMDSGSTLQTEDLLSLIELQKDQGLGASRWPAELVERITVGDGRYTYPEAMKISSPEAARLLSRCCEIARNSSSVRCRTADIVHQDLNPNNILVEESIESEFAGL